MKKISKFLPFNYQDRKIIDLHIFNIQINDYYESQSTENKKHIFLKMKSINELCKWFIIPQLITYTLVFQSWHTKGIDGSNLLFDLISVL